MIPREEKKQRERAERDETQGRLTQRAATPSARSVGSASLSSRACPRPARSTPRPLVSARGRPAETSCHDQLNPTGPRIERSTHTPQRHVELLRVKLAVLRALDLRAPRLVTDDSHILSRPVSRASHAWSFDVLRVPLRRSGLARFGTSTCAQISRYCLRSCRTSSTSSPSNRLISSCPTPCPITPRTGPTGPTATPRPSHSTG
eukprot:782048-Rhodomonas_salina.6